MTLLTGDSVSEDRHCMALSHKLMCMCLCVCVCERERPLKEEISDAMTLSVE